MNSGKLPDVVKVILVRPEIEQVVQLIQRKDLQTLNPVGEKGLCRQDLSPGLFTEREKQQSYGKRRGRERYRYANCLEVADPSAYQKSDSGAREPPH